MRHPRIAHRVWLGPHTPNPEHATYADRFAEVNPGWTVITWTDAMVADLTLVNGDLYDEAPTYVHRADLILYEVVYRYGGLAFGYDMEALRNVEDFIGDHECWCTPDADLFPGQAFFGATPEHPAIRAVMDRAGPRIGELGGWNQPHIDTGPYLWGDVFGRHGQRAHVHGLDVIGTWRTAYPVRYWEKEIFADPVRYAARIRGSLMVHRFAFTWANPDAVKVVTDA